MPAITTYSHEGDVIVRFTPPTLVEAGEPYPLTAGNDFWGIPSVQVPANTEGEFRIVGVFRCVKNTPAEVFAVGDGATYSGGTGFDLNGDFWRCSEASASGETHVNLHINPHAVGTAGGGETNTASNQGAGIGVFDGKVAADLQFRSIVAASTKLSVALDAGNKEIDLDVVPANILTSELNNDEGWSDDKQLTLYVVDFSTALTAGDGKAYWRVPSDVGGKNLANVAAQLGAVQGSTVTTVQIARLRAATPGGARAAADMLSTLLTVDANEWDSKDAATPAVIDGANDDVQEGDLLRIDVDGAGTGAQGLFVSLGFA